MDIARFDLNLLRVFEAVFQERSVTRAAQRLHLTQSAVSNALTRLRGAFGDDLFMRSAAGMEPTALAEEMYGPIRSALEGVRAAVALNLPFEPARAAASFTLGMSDHAELVLGPPLIASVARDAPAVELTIRHCDKGTAFELLDSGAIQIAVGMLPEAPARMTRILLPRDPLVTLMRDGHPAAEGAFDLERFLAFPHLLVSATAGRVGAIDRALAEAGRRRDLRAVVSHLLVAGPILQQSDLFCTMPEQVARSLAGAFGLAVRPAPLPVPLSRMSMIWHNRHDRQPAHLWLRRLMAGIARAEGSGHTAEV
ncbi:LysR family transcriptional regulator [Azospirillum sp. SYSU D00513]|uniref:LysR family transcriptional regulator n=1 Tax=Azospirillum sp. SYSU D00513 TaxID=2812561 RepID=UPI001A96E59E|nr:LysR family transcriptional regulator [Azospirillum sp. SYSU D00513]